MADDETLDESVDQAESESPEQNKSPEQDESPEKEKSIEDKLKEAIQVDVEDVGTLRKKLTISVPRETMDEQLNEQYGELRRDAMVPGFRKGRAPRRLLEKRFGSEVGETLVQQFVSMGYTAAIEKLDLKAISDPLIWVPGDKDEEGEMLVEATEAIRRLELPDDGPMVYSCEVEIRPEFDIPELEGIPLEKPIVETTEDDINQQVDRLRAMRGTYDSKPEGQVEADDMVTADVKMTSEGTVLKEQETVRVAARSQVIDGVSLDQLGDALVGAKVGDVKTISGQIGDDYVKVEFRGKQADFEFKIREIQRLRMPELNEEFIKSLGFEAESELRDWIKNERESRLQEEISRLMRVQVQKYLVEKTSFELPEQLSNRQSERIAAQHLLELYQQGVPPAEAEKLMDELKTSAREDAVRQLKLAFVMEKLSEQFEAEVSEEEINARIAQIALQQGRRFDRVRDELAKQGALGGLYLGIRDQKIIDQLIAKAKITETQPQEAEDAKKPSAEKSSVGKKPSEEKSSVAKKKAPKQEQEKTTDEPAVKEKKEKAATKEKTSPKRKPPGKAKDKTAD